MFETDPRDTLYGKPDHIQENDDRRHIHTLSARGDTFGWPPRLIIGADAVRMCDLLRRSSGLCPPMLQCQSVTGPVFPKLPELTDVNRLCLPPDYA